MIYELLDFLDDLFIAGLLILFTSIIHAIGLDRIMAVAEGILIKAKGQTFKAHIYKIIVGVFCILGIFFLITIHIWLWAATYMLLHVSELKTLEDAVYFSTVTFTTLGFGDIILKEQWRVLSGIEAANGIVILGWSTAFIFEIMTALYPRTRR